MYRGEIYWINLEPASPPELGNVRPGLVLSNSEQNAILPSVIVVPISSRPPEIWPLRLALPETSGLARVSFAVLPGMRQASKSRLQERVGRLPDAFLTELDAAVKAYLHD